MSDRYLKKQAEIINNENLPEDYRKDAAWRFSSYCNDKDLSLSGDVDDTKWEDIKKRASKYNR